MKSSPQTQAGSQADSAVSSISLAAPPPAESATPTASSATLVSTSIDRESRIAAKVRAGLTRKQAERWLADQEQHDVYKAKHPLHRRIPVTR